MTESSPEDVVEVNPNLVEASVWRLGPGGALLASVPEVQAAWLAAQEPQSIYFYADLDRTEQTTLTADTLQKVYRALSAQGLHEGQIVEAVNTMQNAGILFRERMD